MRAARIVGRDEQIDKAVAGAAETAKGGRLHDPLFCKPEHRALWMEVIRTVLDVADAVPMPMKKSSPVSREEVQKFSEHCVYVRSIYTVAIRIFRDVDDAERKSMEATMRCSLAI